MGPVDFAGVEPADAQESSPDRRRRLVVGAVGIGLVAVLVAVALRWWRSGGARRTVTDLAEVSAVALADVIVDEFLPGD
jgi:ferric-dicitrate binding protein FerR (iron transport regulator)